MQRDVVHTPQKTVAFAKELRRKGNPAEKYLWSKLRKKQFHGLKFRKQVPFGPYIADFLCKEKLVIVEIDGDSHHEDEGQEKDKQRDLFFQEHGYAVLRVGHRETL